MKRRPVKLGVFLLLLLLLVGGAIVNVAVAWGCSLPRLSEGKSTRLDAATLHELHMRFSSMGMTPGFDDKGYRFVLTGRVVDDVACKRVLVSRHEMVVASGLTHPLVTGSRMRTHLEATEVQAGWPTLSLNGLRTRRVPLTDVWGDSPDAYVYFEAIETPESWVERGLPKDSWFPMNPLFPGFAINTILYAALLWVLWITPGKIRRFMRVRRGRCPACAYPIGTSPVCTECGQPLPRR